MRPAMTAVRALMNGRPVMAMLLVLLALLARALVPAGYMPAEGSRSFTVMLCNDSNAQAIRIAIPVDAQGKDEGKGKGSHADSPCAFGALAGASLGGADAPLLAVALEHILALGFLPVTAPVLQGVFHLRPPLRGPPSLF